VSFITFAEMRGGAERGRCNREARRRLEQLTRLVPAAHPGGSGICHRDAEHFTRLRAAGTPIGANDLWSGCHALAESAALVTNNQRDFRRLAGLSAENWAAA
jgi:tRNA(fMet)-specific endonuclease VapC